MQRSTRPTARALCRSVVGLLSACASDSGSNEGRQDGGGFGGTAAHPGTGATVSGGAAPPHGRAARDGSHGRPWRHRRRGRLHAGGRPHAGGRHGPHRGASGTGGGGAGGVGTGGSGATGGGHPVPDEPIGFASLDGGTVGGLGGEVVTVSSFSELQSYAESSSRAIIMVAGTISNGSEGGRIDVQSNKSIIGVGSTALLSGVGLYVNNVDNVIIRNLTATLVGTSNPSNVNGGDIISNAGSSKNKWIDHWELCSEPPDQQTDIDKYDGLVDIKHQTGFITISHSYFHDHHKGGLVGSADDDLLRRRHPLLVCRGVHRKYG